MNDFNLSVGRELLCGDQLIYSEWDKRRLMEAAKFPVFVGYRLNS